MPWLFWLLLVVAAAVAVLAAVRPGGTGRRREAEPPRRVANSAGMFLLPRVRSRVRQQRWLHAGAGLLVLIALLAAAGVSARPVSEVERSDRLANRDIVLCLDVSTSMITIDASVLETFSELLDSFDGERVALVAWNSTAQTIVPLTDDYDLLGRQMEDLADVLDIDPANPTSRQVTAYEDALSGTMSYSVVGSSLAGDGLASCAMAFDNQGWSAPARSSSPPITSSSTPTGSRSTAWRTPSRSWGALHPVVLCLRDRSGPVRPVGHREDAGGGAWGAGDADAGQRRPLLRRRGLRYRGRHRQAAGGDPGRRAGRGRGDAPYRHPRAPGCRPRCGCGGCPGPGGVEATVTLLPMLPWPVLALAAVLVVLLLWLARARLDGARAEPAAYRSWWRRVALACLVVLILVGPALRSTESVSVSNVEVYLLVDRTGSMAAEDWAGPAPDGVASPAATRLDGVRADLAAVREAHPSARYSILALDSAAAVELPLSNDVDAVDAWVGSLTQEVTDRSTGSSLDTALPLLGQTLSRSYEEDPDAIRLVYVLSDGEDTDGGKGAQEAAEGGWTWQSLAGVVDGGAVLGYGTAEGGPMRSYDGTAATGEHTDADYIMEDDGGQPAVSVIDEERLGSVATSLGLDYLHRTGGSQDDPTQAFTDIDLEAVVSDGQASGRARRYVVWPLALAASLLLVWEAGDLVRADRRLRALTAGRTGT
nr:VWA domain-containing protein [Actinomyces lilanjuaniae]